MSAFRSGAYLCTKNGDLIGFSNKHGGLNVKGKKLSTRTAHNGYLLSEIVSSKNQLTVSTHQLVWIFFNGPYDTKNKNINHKNGNKIDNSIKNLELLTPSENHRHAHKIGLMNQRGSNNGASKMTLREAMAIRNIYKDGMYSMHRLAIFFDISTSNIHRILNKKSWNYA